MSNSRVIRAAKIFGTFTPVVKALQHRSPQAIETAVPRPESSGPRDPHDSDNAETPLHDSPRDRAAERTGPAGTSSGSVADA
jgi:hypothetical protein